MSKIQIRYGTGQADKIRSASVTAQQIAELAAVTGKGKVEVVQEAIVLYYMQVVGKEQEKRIILLQEENENLRDEISRLVAADGGMATKSRKQIRHSPVN